jgi:hypothetical protein
MAKIFLQYGNYPHELADAAVSIQRVGVPNEAGQIFATREVWTIQGRLEADTQAELGTKIAALEDAYKRQASKVALKFEGGADTAHVMNIQNMLSPITVTQQPSYPVGAGAEYTTFRNYTIQVEGLVKTDLAQADLIFYRENVSTSGGFPRDVLVQTLNTPPVRQRVADFTPFIVRQAGRAISLRGWVIRPQPKLNILSQAVLIDDSYEKLGPIETFANGVRIQSRFESTWSWILAAPVQLSVPGTRRPLAAPVTLR